MIIRLGGENKSRPPLEMKVLIPISDRWPQVAAGTIGGWKSREHYDTNAQTLPFAFPEAGVVCADGPRRISITIILPKTGG
jgi:hypothetical protein